MKFNLNFYSETIKELTELNNGINNYKSHSLATQKEYLIRDNIQNGNLEIRN